MFATAHTPAITDTLSTYATIEASFPGYAPATIERTITANTWGSPGLNGGLIDPINTNSRASYGSKLGWSSNGSQTIYGHFWSAPTSNVAILAEQWASPLAAIPGSLISLRPNLELGGPRTSLAWRHMQSAGNTIFNTDTLSATFPGAVTEGNLIVVGLGNDTSGGTFTITDNFNNTSYNQAVVGGGSVASGTASIFWFIVPSGGGGYPFVVTFDSQYGTYPVMSVDEYMFPTNTLVIVGATGSGEASGTVAEISAGTINVLQQESDTKPGPPLLLESLYRLKTEEPPLLPAVGSSMCYSVVKAWDAENQTITPSPGFTTRYAIPWVGAPNYVNGWFSEDRVNATGTLDTSVVLSPASNWVLASAIFQTTGWYHVQGTGQTTFTLNPQDPLHPTLDAMFPQAVTAGNLIVVGLGNDVSGGTFVVSDNINHLPYQVAVTAGTGGTATILWFVVPQGGGGDSFTVSFSSQNATYPVMSIDEYMVPIGYSVIVDSYDGAAGVDDLARSGASLTVTGIDLICSVCKAWGVENQSISPPAGFESRYNTKWSASPAVNGISFADGINRNRGVMPSFALSPASDWVIASVAFKASSQAQQTTFMLMGLL